MKKQNNKYRRLFLALWPDPGVRSQVSACQQNLALHNNIVQRGKPVRPENLHLTLCFLGIVAEDQIELLCSHLAEIRHPAFVLQLHGQGYFPGPRILWLGVKQPQSALSSLVEKINQAVQDALPEYKPGGNKFTAHISLFRNVDNLVEAEGSAEISWSVSDFALVESVSTDDGVLYRVLQHWPLEQVSTAEA